LADTEGVESIFDTIHAAAPIDPPPLVWKLREVKRFGVKTGAGIWSYLAPIGNGATVYFFLNKKQHERFLTGVTTFKATETELVVTLPIATKSIDALKGAHSAIATFVGASLASNVIETSVSGDKLTLKLDAAPGGAGNTVAWIVDLQPENKIEGVKTA